MATTIKETTESSLADDFQFDTTEFFGVKPTNENNSGINEKRTKGTIIKDENVLDEGDDDGDEVTSLEDDKNKSKTKVKTSATATKKDEEFDNADDDAEGDEEIEPTFFADEPTKKTVAKAAPTKTKVTEPEVETDDEEDGDVDKTKTQKTKVKAEADTEPDEDKDEENDEAKDEEFYTTLAGEMVEQGILQNIELKDGEKVTVEKFFELQDQEIEARVNETVEALIEDLDEDGKAFLKFKKDGGRTIDFLSTFADDLGMDEFDETDESQVERVLTHYFSTVEELDADDIADKIKWLKEGGKHKAKAAKYFENIKKQETQRKTALIEGQKKIKETTQATNKKFNEEFAQVALGTTTVGNFPISKIEQKKAIDSITKATVKVGKDRYIPSFQYKLSEILKAKTKEDKQKLLLISSLIDNDFKVDGLVTKVKTEEARKIKSKIKEAKEQGIKTNSAGGRQKRSLAEFFPE